MLIRTVRVLGPALLFIRVECGDAAALVLSFATRQLAW